MIQFFWDTGSNVQLESLIRAVLNHTEGNPATLTITVREHQFPASQRLRGLEGRLMYVLPQGFTDPDSTVSSPGQNGSDTKHLLFWGKTVGFTEKQGQIDIHLMAEKATFKDQWPNVLNTIKANNPHHELWPEDDPNTILDAVPYAWYWDRCTGILGISHAFQGYKTWDVSDQYDPKYHVVQKKEPLSQINVQLSALWDQSILDYVDVAPEIAKHFHHGVIGTLTDRALESAWPETGRLFPSGYFVAHSSLTKKPASTQHPNAIVFSPPAEGDGSAAHWITEPHFYDAKLVMGYFYRQKRKEQVNFTLKAALPNNQHGRTQVLDITLPPCIRYDDLPLWSPVNTYDPGEEVQHQGRVYRFYRDDPGQDIQQNRGEPQRLSRNGFDPSQQQWEEIPEKTKWLLPSVSDSFFNLTLGKEWFQYTLHRAKTALIWGTRCVEVQVRGTLKDFHNITLDDSITLREHPDSEKTITGKVVDYTLEMDGLKQTASVQIKGAFFMHFDDVYAPGGNEKTIIIDGLHCFWPEKKPPEDVISQKLKENVCKKIEVSYPINDQLQHLETLSQKMWTAEWDASSVQAKETRIRLHFHSLRTRQCLENSIPVEILTPYRPERDG